MATAAEIATAPSATTRIAMMMATAPSTTTKVAMMMVVVMAAVVLWTLVESAHVMFVMRSMSIAAGALIHHDIIFPRSGARPAPPPLRTRDNADQRDQENQANPHQEEKGEKAHWKIHAFIPSLL
jgi:hypothetical protein